MPGNRRREGHLAWTFVVRRTAYGPERVQADAPHSAEAHRNALLRNALKKTISSSGDRERDLRGVQTRHQQCATKQVRVSMAGVASDRRWPRLVRGSDASVQGLRVISVQLCSRRCAPRRAAGGLQAIASTPVRQSTGNFDAQELLWWPSDRAHADEGEKWDDNSCRMAGLQPKVPT